MAMTSDFRFWEERVPIHRQSTPGDSSGDYIEFRVQKHHDQDHQSSTTDSPPLWTELTPKNSTVVLEAKSPLLPHDHHYSSCLSPTSRSRAILEGKRELMEMIKDLPESSLELSLKDIVEDHAEVKEVVLVEDIKKTNNRKIGKRIIGRIRNNNKNTTRSKICRTESMESGVFLLKMFLPASLMISSKKRSDSRKWPADINIGQQPASEGSEKSQASSKWWKITFLFLRDYKNRRNIGGNINSEISSGKNRLVDGSCQWWWCFHKKC